MRGARGVAAVNCDCRCHRPPDAPFHTRAVDARDVLEAAVACRVCLNRHAPALRNTALPGETPAAPRGGPTVITPEGRQMTWAAYQREMENRADAWRHQEPEEQ